MKKIISAILIVTLCLNSVGSTGLTLAQNNNHGIENDLDKKEDSVEESTKNLNDEEETEEESVDSKNETKKENDELEKEESKEADDETQEEKEEKEETRESIEETEDESKESESSEENKTEENETKEDLNKEEFVEETSESDEAEEIASPSEIKKFDGMNKLYGADDYVQKQFTIYLDLSKTYDDKQLPQALYSNIYSGRIELASQMTDVYGEFTNGGTWGNNDEFRFTYYDWKNNGGLDTVSNIFRGGNEERFEEVIPVYNSYGEAMYYIEEIQLPSTLSGIKLNNGGYEAFFRKDYFTKVVSGGEVKYELTFYPTKYKPLLIQDYTYEFVDPDTGSLYDVYQGSVSGSYDYDEARRAFNGGNLVNSNCDLYIDIPVYTDDNKDGFIFKTWDDYQYTDSDNYKKTRKIHAAFKTLDWLYNPDEDADVDRSNPYTFIYKLVPERSDIYELPLTEDQQRMKDQFSNYVNTAILTKRNFKLVFEVYKMADIKYYNNEGTEQIENVRVSLHTQVTTGKWPNSFPPPGVNYITGFYVLGWNREPGQSKDDDESSILAGQVIDDEDARKGLKLYAVGDVAETFKIKYDLNLPASASSAWRVEQTRAEDIFTHDGNTTAYYMHGDPVPHKVQDISFGMMAYIRDVDNNIVLKPKERQEFIAEDGRIYAYFTEAFKTGLDTKEKWLEAFGDDKEYTVKYNWEAEPTNIKYRFKLKDTTNSDYLGDTEWISGESVNILDDVSGKLSNDYLVNLYKSKNSDYNSSLNSYINYEVVKVDYPENTIENNLLIRLDAKVTVYLAKKVRFTYIDSKGNDITTKIEQLAATDNLPYVENDYGLYPVNPLYNESNKSKIVDNKMVTAWKLSPTATNYFSKMNSDYQFSSGSGYKVDTDGTTFYTVEESIYTVKFETVASMSYVWPGNVDRSVQNNLRLGDGFYVPTVKGNPEDKYYHDGWTLNGTVFNLTHGEVTIEMDALLEPNKSELVFRPIIKELAAAHTVKIVVDSTKANYTGKSDYDDLTEFNTDKATIKNTISVLPTWKFTGFKERTSGQDYKTDLSDFTWDGNTTVELVAQFELIIKNLTFEIDSTKATVNPSAKLIFDTSEVGSIVIPTMTVNAAYEFTRWTKKGTTTQVDPATWDGVDDLTVVAEFRLLYTLKFDVTATEIESVTGTIDFNEKSTSITIPTIICKGGKKISGWVINGNNSDVKTTAEIQNYIANWNKTSNVVIAPRFANLKTLTFVIPSDKATVPVGVTLVYDEESTNIQRPNFTTKAGFKFVRWKKGSTDIEDSALLADIAAWTKTADVTYEAFFSTLKTFKLIVDNNYLETPLNPPNYEYDEDNLPPTTLPTITPKRGYNKPSDNGGWSTKANGTKSDILSAADLQNIINDFRTKPSDQKQNVVLYYVFVEDDTITKLKLNYDKAKGRLEGGPDLYTEVSVFDSNKANVNIVPNNNYTFSGWKDSATGTVYSKLLDVTWDGSISVTLDAVFVAKTNNTPNNGGGNSGGGSSGGGSSSDNPTTPPAGFIPNNPPQTDIIDPNKPVDPNQPLDPNQPTQTEEERKEREDNPPADDYLIVDMDSSGSGSYDYAMGIYEGRNTANYYNWETKDRMTWRLIDMRYLEEKVHYNKTNEKSVVESLDKPEINYYEDGWVLLEYRNTKEWYHFDKEGIMNVGWFEQGGKFYYLQTIYNTTYGKMLVGEYVLGGVTCVFGKNGVLETIKP